jgi:hypothetical protein
MMNLRNSVCLVAVATAVFTGACANSDARSHSSGSSAGGQGGRDSGAAVDVPAAVDEVPAPPADAPADTANVPEVVADAPSDPGASSGDAGGVCGNLFCEDFEQGMIDPAKWLTQMGGSGTVEVQQQIVHRGKYAYHVHGSGTALDFAMIVAKDVPMALKGPGPLFGRVYVYANTNVGSHVELGFAGSTRDPAAAPLIGRGSMNFVIVQPRRRHEGADRARRSVGDRCLERRRS